MSFVYTGVAGSFAPGSAVQATLPSDGDAASAASVNNPGPLEHYADALEWFRQNVAVVSAAAPAIVYAFLSTDETSVANNANLPLTAGGYLSIPAFIAPFAGKVSKLYCYGSAAGSGRVGVGINSFSINTSVVAALTAGAVTSDLTHTATFAAGDQVFLIYNNNTGGTVANLRAGVGIYVEITLA